MPIEPRFLAWRNETKSRLTIAALVLLLTGCGSGERASFVIDDRYTESSFVFAVADVAMTLERDKSYIWSDRWELNLVVRHNPDCQRRHRLDTAFDDGFKMDVYRADDRGVFILREKDRWYVTELKSCRLQKFKTPPPEPGELIGAFKYVKGVFTYVPVGKLGREPADGEHTDD